MSDEVFLKLEGIKKSFGGVHALQGVDLEIRKGEIHCLAGENGCGKSTLIKAISGVHVPDEGRILINGEEMKNMKPMDAINRGIQVIYQDFAVFPNLTVAENIALNGELKDGVKLVNWRQIHKVAAEAMKRVGVKIDPDIRLERLSVANKQLVAICRAIMNDARLLILDEPTTALTAREVESLWDIIRAFEKVTHDSGVFQRRREEQLLDWVHSMVDEHLHNLFFDDPVIQGRMPEIKEAVLKGVISPTQAVAELINMFDIERAAKRHVDLLHPETNN